MTLLFVFVLGLVVGLLSSVLGVGGGILIVPLLPLVVSLPLKSVIATSLMTILITSALNNIYFQKQRLIPWHVVMRLFPISVVVGYGSGLIAVGLADITLKYIFSGILLSIATFIMANFNPRKAETRSPTRFKPVMWGWTALSGIVAGFTGLGAGVLMSSFMVSDKDFEVEKIAPTSNFLMTINAAVALPPYLFFAGGDELGLFGFLQFEVFLALLTGSLLLSRVGVRYQHLVPRTVRACCLATLLVMGAIKTMLW